jgi:hypothetical protein
MTVTIARSVARRRVVSWSTGRRRSALVACFALAEACLRVSARTGLLKVPDSTLWASRVGALNESVGRGNVLGGAGWYEPSNPPECLPLCTPRCELSCPAGTARGTYAELAFKHVPELRQVGPTQFSSCCGRPTARSITQLRPYLCWTRAGARFIMVSHLATMTTSKRGFYDTAGRPGARDALRVLQPARRLARLYAFRSGPCSARARFLLRNADQREPLRKYDGPQRRARRWHCGRLGGGPRRV